MERRSFSAPPGMHDRMNCSPRGSAARNRARWDWRTAESSRCRRREKWRSFWDLSPFLEGIGTLARASLAGGLPREVLERVTEADWGPDGALAVVNRGKNKMELEFPVGTKVHEARSIWSMRVSPKGNSVAFFESSAPGIGGTGEVVVVDSSLKTTTLAKPSMALGLVWSPPGDEVWFSGAQSDGPPAIRAVSLSGRERLVERVPAPLEYR